MQFTFFDFVFLFVNGIKLTAVFASSARGSGLAKACVERDAISVEWAETGVLSLFLPAEITGHCF
ncbi:hypothetical protein EYS10_23790 [Rahnella aquatilis]|nr:hypothetical protein EYS10_23790 [Rahnella aquatilis]